MKKYLATTIFALLLLLLLPSTLWAKAEMQPQAQAQPQPQAQPQAQAQYSSVLELVEAYSSREGVDYMEANKAVIWMIKAKMPKEAKKSIDKIYILSFKADSASESYPSFRAEALELFAQLNIECLKEEATKDGTMELFLEPMEAPSEYIMFMHAQDGDNVFMLMQGKL